MLNLFDRAGKTLELIEFLNRFDIKTLARVPETYIARLLSFAPTDSKTSPHAQALFRKAWIAFPQSRLYFARTTLRNDIWRMPEAFDYLSEIILPNEPRQFASDEYSSFLWRTAAAATGASAAPGDAIPPLLLRFLDLAEERGVLDRLLERIEDCRKKDPGWKTGAGVQALVLCRLGRHDEARALVPQTIDALRKDETDVNSTVKFMVYWTLAVELERYPANRNLACTAYRACLTDPYALLQFRLLSASERSPIRQYVPLSIQAGRRDEARRTLIDLARSRWPDGSYSEELVTVIRMVALDAIGDGLIELGFSADAVPVLRDAQILSERADLTLTPTLFPGLPETPERVRQHLNIAIDRMSPSELAAIARSSIIEAAQVPTATQAPINSASKPRAAGLDLITLVHPRSLDQALVRSLVADSIGASEPAQLAALAAPLEAVRKAHPEELSVAICVALDALASKDLARMQSSLEQLAQLMEKTPLDGLGEGAKANARERRRQRRRSRCGWSRGGRAGSRTRSYELTRPGLPRGRSKLRGARTIACGCWRCFASKGS